MKYDLTKTEDYLLVVDDLNRPAKEGETFLSKEGFIHTNIGYNYGDKLIIAHLPLKETKTIEGVDLLPPLPQGDDVEKLSENFLKDLQVASTSVNRSVKLGFEVGYNIAKETYKYTQDDMINAFKLGERGIKYQDHFADVWEDFKKLLQQQPKLPIAFECEMVTTEYYFAKTITNSQGQTEWVGKYIYE
jgi:hypothetical protein